MFQVTFLIKTRDYFTLDYLLLVRAHVLERVLFSNLIISLAMRQRRRLCKWWAPQNMTTIAPRGTWKCLIYGGNCPTRFLLPNSVSALPSQEETWDLGRDVSEIWSMGTRNRNTNISVIVISNIQLYCFT